MKTLKIAAIALFTTASLCAQDLRSSEVPNNLTSKFNDMHTNASDVEWEKEGNLYKVDFEINNQDHEIWFTESGETSRMEKELQKNELPPAIKTMLSADYADYDYDDIKWIKKEGTVSYEVEIDNGSDEKTLLIDENAKVTETRMD